MKTGIFFFMRSAFLSKFCNAPSLSLHTPFPAGCVGFQYSMRTGVPLPYDTVLITKQDAYTPIVYPRNPNRPTRAGSVPGNPYPPLLAPSPAGERLHESDPA